MFRPVPPRALIVTLGALILLAPRQEIASGRVQANDLAFLEPWIEVRQADRELLAQRGVVVRALPSEGRQIAVLAVCAANVSPEVFITRVREAGEIKLGQLGARRFSDPPALTDLAALSLDQGDLDRIRRCQPGACALNLAATEMAALQLAATNVTNNSAGDSQQLFRQILLDRVLRYRSGGMAALPEYQDRREAVRPVAVFSSLLQRPPDLRTYMPEVADYLERFPGGVGERADSFLHWSKLIINNKAVVTVTHLTIFQSRAAPTTPRVLLAGKQVFASRYMNGELTLTMLFTGRDGAPAYLVHVERSDLDELVGMFSGLKRAVLERGISEEAGKVMKVLRDRLERAENSSH